MNNQTKTSTVSAPDIVCSGCAGAIKNALGKVKGVSSVEVDVDTKRVSVEHGGEISREQIVDVLDRAGFPAN